MVRVNNLNILKLGFLLKGLLFVFENFIALLIDEHVQVLIDLGINFAGIVGQLLDVFL